MTEQDALLPHVVLVDDTPSLWSRLLDALIRVIGRKRQWASASTVHARVRRLARRPASHRPTGIGRGARATLRAAEGWPVYHVEPGRDGGARHHVVFLHGGGYINEIVRTHWRFVDHLTARAHAHCIVPIYPLAPRGTAADVVPATGRLLRETVATHGAENVTVIGNSAGGGLALAATQWLRDAGFSRPKGLILISPALDAQMDYSEQVAIAADDVMQDIPGLTEAMRLYAGDLDVTHPFVSPLNGNLRDLPAMTVFTSTFDLFYPDSIALSHKAARAGVPVEMYVRSGLPHNYALLPTPEGREARDIIARVIAT